MMMRIDDFPDEFTYSYIGLAQILGRTRAAVAQMAQRGEIPFEPVGRIGSALIWRKADALAWKKVLDASTERRGRWTRHSVPNLA